MDEALESFDHAACGLLRTADDGTILAVNRTFCRWIGASPEALVGKRRFQDLLTVGGRIFHQTHWMPLLQMQGSISEVKLEMIHADGPTFPVVVNTSRRERSGVFVHEIAAFVARDRDKYERELVVSRKRLEEAASEAKRLHDEAKDRAVFAEQLIGIVSHDLRNPLSIIAMAASLLARESLSEGQRSMLERIRRASARGGRLIADLLDFTQARLGRGLTVEPHDVDLHRVIADAVDELAHLHPTRTIVHLPAGQGPCFADAHRLSQIVGNLVSNAIAYGDPLAAVTIHSSIDTPSFAVAVHNYGTPIPAEVRAVIFDAMARGTTSGRTERSVGLGLFIVRELVKAHGGHVGVTSTKEEGTTFVATFPRRV